MLNLNRSLIRRYRLPLLCASLASCTALVACASLQHGKGSGIVCKLEQVKDTQKSGLVAFTYFVPTGWTPHHTMSWLKYDNYIASLSASTSDKHYSVSQLEPTVMSYSSLNSGAVTGIRINHATDFLHAVADQIKKQLNLEEVTTVEELNEPLPLLPAQENAQNQNWGPLQTRSQLHESGYLKISFTLDGVEETAEMGTTVAGTNTRMHRLNDPSSETSSFGVYRVGPTMTIVSPSSPTKTKVREVQLIAASMRETPQFDSYRRKLTTALAKAQLGANYVALRQHDADFHEQSMAKFRGEMAAKDANTHQFCNYIQDQQDYRTPSGSTVTLPTAYKHAWADGSGNYLLTDDPTVDPRGYGSGKWEEMAKARPND